MTNVDTDTADDHRPWPEDQEAQRIDLEMVERVYQLRGVLAAYQRELKASLAAWEATVLTLNNAKQKAQRELDEAEATLKAAAILAWQEEGDKKPQPGVEVKFFKLYGYDPDKALAWAKEHRIALIPERLDEKEFLRIKPLDLVTVKEEPRAMIAADLGKALGLA